MLPKQQSWGQGHYRRIPLILKTLYGAVACTQHDESAESLSGGYCIHGMIAQSPEAVDEWKITCATQKSLLMQQIVACRRLRVPWFQRLTSATEEVGAGQGGAQVGG